MVSVHSFLLTVHVFGVALAVGAATVKTALLFASRADTAVADAYWALERRVTRHILVSLALLATSGIGFLLLGYALTPRLIAKLVLFAAVMAIGPVIDNVAEPKVRRFRDAGENPSAPAFAKARAQHLALEVVATGIFYLIVVVWVLV